MKNTKQKVLILDIINNSTSHNTAAEIYKEARKTISNISLGTVYRNLNSLLNEKKIIKIKTITNIDHYDNIRTSHDHFICNKCSKIIDIFNRKHDILGNISDNKVMSYEIYYKGICKDCLKEEK